MLADEFALKKNVGARLKTAQLQAEGSRQLPDSHVWFCFLKADMFVIPIAWPQRRRQIVKEELKSRNGNIPKPKFLMKKFYRPFNSRLYKFSIDKSRLGRWLCGKSTLYTCVKT